MTENILASSQLTAFYSRYLSIWKSNSWLRAVVNILLTDISGLLSVVYFILSSNVQILSELLTVVTLLLHS